MANTSYTIRPSADGNQYSDYPTGNFVPQLLAPAAPSGLTATAVSSSQINLTWTDNSNNETGFVVERSLNGTSGWSVVATTVAGATGHGVTGLTGSTVYYFRVKATNANGDSAYTPNASATTDAAGVSFQDGFEGGNLSHSENGFFWGGSSTGGPGAQIAVSTTRAKTGTRSLLMRFAGNGTPNSWTEQKMVFTSHPVTEIWVKYDLFVPTNLTLANVNGGNNKFIAIYNGDYTTNFQVNFSYNAPYAPLFPNSIADLAIHFFQNGSEQPTDNYGSTHAAELFTAADRGTWVQIIVRVKCTSGFGVADGVMQFWKNGTRIYSYTNIPMWGRAGMNYIDGLYLLGWANTGFPATTDFYIDDVQIATSNQWGVS